MQDLSGGGIYKTSLQADIFQNSQEVEFINHQYRLKYSKILKILNLQTINTGRIIAKLSRGWIYKPRLQDEISYLHSSDKNDIWRQ